MCYLCKSDIDFGCVVLSVYVECNDIKGVMNFQVPKCVICKGRYK